jgi:hypothetical protein
MSEIIRIGIIQRVEGVTNGRGIGLGSISVVISNRVLNCSDLSILFNSGTAGGYAAGNVCNSGILDSGNNTESGTVPSANVDF